MIEKKIRKLINSNFQHIILGEEKGLTNKQSYFTWIIDPIDGTNAYITGVLFWFYDIFKI